MDLKANPPSKLKVISDKCRDLSLPLIAGVILALIVANVFPEFYHHVAHGVICTIGNHEVTFHWLINDVFMALFFGMACVELVHSLSPGGALNPVKKAVAPLMATAGGVIGPVVIFFILNAIIGDPSYFNGWGVCTATDIALAWLIAKLLFGAHHAAVTFLLLLAVADDAIGLVIIAVFYPQPGKEVQPIFLLLVPAAMLLALILRKCKVNHYAVYLLTAGIISWFGMFKAGLHPALALVFIIPLMPRQQIDKFEHQLSPIVDYGMFFFGFVCAGVQFTNVSMLSLIVFLSFMLGKSGGITLFSFVAVKLGIPLPQGMKMTDVLVVGLVGGVGLTVALFVAESAFASGDMIAAAKMGALFSVFVAIPATIIRYLCRRIRYKKLIKERLERANKNHELLA